MITGGTSGIGLAFARALATRGCDLILVARNEERLASVAAQLASEHGVDCQTMVADLGTEEGVQAATRFLASQPVEVLINNAGYGLHHRLATTDVNPLKDAIEVMVTSVVRMGAAAGASMKERGHGVIVNTASVAGLVPMGLYSAIKAFVRMWSYSLTLELARHGVQVVTFMPGWVRTEFHERSGISTSNIPDALWLDADAVVDETLRAIDRGKTRVTPSLRFKAISALAEHAPKRVVHKVAAKISRGRG